MQKHFLPILTIVLILIISAFTFAQSSDTTHNDAGKKAKHQFKNVDVEVIYAWGEKEKSEGVDADVNYKQKKPESITIYSGGHKSCDIFIRGGVVIKIYDHNTRKLLKTFKG